jgi:hypothetical protein
LFVIFYFLFFISKTVFISWGLNLFFWSLFKWFLTFSDLGLSSIFEFNLRPDQRFLTSKLFAIVCTFLASFLCVCLVLLWSLTGCWIHLILEAGSTYFWCEWVGTWVEFHVVDWSVLIFFLLQRKKKSYLVHLGLMKTVCIVVGACSLVYYRPAAALEYYRLLSFWIWCSSAASLGNPRPWIMFSWLLLPCLWTLLQQRLGPWATLQ